MSGATMGLMVLFPSEHVPECSCEGCAVERTSDALKRLGRYPLQAYAFAGETVQFLMRRVAVHERRRRQISAKEVVEGAVELAWVMFGPLSSMVFDVWGVSHSRDFGRMVEDMCDLEIMRRSKSDRFEDFADADLDFRKAFEQRRLRWICGKEKI